MRCAAAALSTTFALTACGAGGPEAAPPVAPTTAEDARGVGHAGSWPDPRPPAAATCTRLYPEDLAQHATAFDGTVTAVHIGQYDEHAAATPATVDLAVHEAFAGPPRTVVTMRTWTFMLPAQPATIVGLRVLLAAGPTLELKACGYSRPYGRDEATTWRQSFRSPPHASSS